MKSMRKNIIVLCVLAIFAGQNAAGQQIVESVVAVVGNEVVYLSEIEGQVVQLKAERDPTPVTT